MAATYELTVEQEADADRRYWCDVDDREYDADPDDD